jgi:hypothetical protein
MLFLVVPVVYQDRLELLVFAYIGTLVVRVDGYQFFSQGDKRFVHVAHFLGHFMFGFVRGDAVHIHTPLDDILPMEAVG